MKHKLYLFIIAVFICTSLVAQTETEIKSLKVGDNTVYLIYETEFATPTSVLSSVKGETFTLEEDTAMLAACSFLIKTPEANILVDVGVGFYENKSVLIDKLNKLGVKRDEIDLILITHAHLNHISGLLDNEGKVAFPNADLYISKEDSDYWLDQKGMYERHKARAKRVPPLFDPYKAINKFKTFEANATLPYGIKSIAAHGHTMGHTVYTLSGGGKEIWFVGDIIHFTGIQFDHPYLSPTHDTHPEDATKARHKLFKNAAEKKVVLAASHAFDFFKVENKDGKIISVPVD